MWREFLASLARFPIKILVEGVGEARGELVSFYAPRTVEAILRSLPIEGRAAIWKEEVYFEIPVKIGGEKQKPNVEKGAIAYWPMGSALCIFYGESQPYSSVNVVGKIVTNLDLFKDVKSGTKIRVEKA